MKARHRKSVSDTLTKFSIWIESDSGEVVHHQLTLRDSIKLLKSLRKAIKEAQQGPNEAMEDKEQ